MEKYIHYQDYYKTNFLPVFEKMKAEAVESHEAELSKKEFCENFVVLFETAYLLLKYYLHNNGLFQFREIDVLREAFTIELIDDGEEWIKTLFLVNEIRDKEFNESCFEDAYKCLSEYLYIFENLNKTFKVKVK